MMRSKPSLRVLVLYIFLLWQLGLPEWQLGLPRAATAADGPAMTPGLPPKEAPDAPAMPPGVPPQAGHKPPVLPPAEVSALQTFVTSLELKPRLNIKETFCNETLSSYGFRVVCTCDEEDSHKCWISEIEMSNVGLTGFIHEAVGYLSNLHRLALSNNKLHGIIPDTLGNLYYLNTLDLSNNQLNGSIPQSLGHSSSSLQWLYLQYNFLDGPIPRSLGLLDQLDQLYLQFNRLYGPIPDELGDLENLTTLDLSENQLSGPLPDSLGNLSSIRTLYVASNYLTGEFPKSYGQLIWLRKFSISGNYISGPLPVDTIKNWTFILSISLVGNNFKGNLTQEVFNLPYLQYLLVSDLSNDGFSIPPNLANKDQFVSLVLRNCSINGSIPKYISEDMPSLKYLDLSFNNLTGVLPDYLKSDLIDMSFSNNNLSGTIPAWIFRTVQTKMDLSFNNFSAIEAGVPSNLELNLFACCRKSSAVEPEMMDPSEMGNQYCPGKKRKYHSLFINCGGGETTVNGTIHYEQDNQTSLSYTSPKKNWAYSSSGEFGAETANSSDYIKSTKCGISVLEAPLFQQARLSPQSLKYYAFCLLEGTYNVTLYFAEIIYTGDSDYTSIRKRAFDVYIQGHRKLNYFNIEEKAGRPDTPITRNFSAVVTDNGVLEIHLYWPGKGSYEYMPSFNGPLISAISVTPEFKVGGDKTNRVRIASITVASVTFPLLLLAAFAWRMDWLEYRKSPEIRIGQEQKGEKFEDKFVTLKELIAATKGFSNKKKISTGGFGTLYEAKLQTYTVAVKKLSSEFKEKIQELKTEIYTLSSLEHDNLIKLWDTYTEKDLQFLVYEHMENKTLHEALFDPKSKVKLTWYTRFDICLGIARGLEYLHELPRRKIVHMNIKAVNILLNEKLEAKISDFGLAHLYSDEDQIKAIKREVEQGYMAPEYFQGNVTSKADVYSFGVLMLEIISGRQNVRDKTGGEAELLLDQAYKFEVENSPQALVDPRLEGVYDEKQVKTMVKLAVRCTSTGPSVRPTMSQVVAELRPKTSNLHLVSEEKKSKKAVAEPESMPPEEPSTSSPSKDEFENTMQIVTLS